MAFVAFAKKGRVRGMGYGIKLETDPSKNDRTIVNSEFAIFQTNIYFELSEFKCFIEMEIINDKG